jgi:hypothetical protein
MSRWKSLALKIMPVLILLLRAIAWRRPISLTAAMKSEIKAMAERRALSDYVHPCRPVQISPASRILPCLRLTGDRMPIWRLASTWKGAGDDDRRVSGASCGLERVANLLLSSQSMSSEYLRCQQGYVFDGIRPLFGNRAVCPGAVSSRNVQRLSMNVQ